MEEEASCPPAAVKVAQFSQSFCDFSKTKLLQMLFILFTRVWKQQKAYENFILYCIFVLKWNGNTLNFQPQYHEKASWLSEKVFDEKIKATFMNHKTRKARWREEEK